MAFETWYLPDFDQVVERVHSGKTCQKPCCVHAPSFHHMRGWRLFFAGHPHNTFARICKHNIQHIDPDDLMYLEKISHMLGPDSRAAAQRALWDCPLCECGCCNPVDWLLDQANRRV